MNPSDAVLKKLSNEELIKLIKILSKNWLTVDGLWFSGVEEKFGLDTAIELDLRMWKYYSAIEIRRLRETFNLTQKGIPGIIEVIQLMLCSLIFDYEIEEVNDHKLVFKIVHCLPQEARLRLGKDVFACQPTYDSAFENLISVVDPRVKFKCLFCPPEPRPEGYWCGWEFTLED